MMGFLNLHELEALAESRLEAGAFGYIRGGAEDEVTLRANRHAFERLRLLPRYLVDVSSIDTRTTVLGSALALPVMLAPVAFQVLAHPDGELASARAAADAGTVFIASTLSSRSLEAIADAGDGPKWFQLYCARDRGLTDALVARAEAAGYQALVITVDVPVAARREADERNRFHLPAAALPGNLAGDLELGGLTGPERQSALVRLVGDLFDPALTWRDIDRLAARTRLPILIKGLLTADDAARAVDHGAAGVVVSNHGGRQLDGAPPAIEVLAEIADCIAGRATVLLDSGIRRGSDVVKAVALGAAAVLIGRPMVWGLAVGGEAGVSRVLALLHEEIARCLALLGRRRLADLDAGVVRPAP